MALFLRGKMRLIRGILWVLTILAAIKMLFAGFGLDEEYEVVLAYRRLWGDRLLQEMWEPHQTSVFLMTFLMRPWIKLVGTTGVVVYVRVCTTLLHALMSYGFYRGFRRLFSPELSGALGLIYFNTIPKLIMMPEFGLVQVWLVTLIALFWICYLQSGRKAHGWMAASGVAMAALVLTYPATALLYPFYFLWTLLRGKEHTEFSLRLKGSLIFGLVPIICGILYLIPLLHALGLDGIMDSVRLILDGTATYDITPAQRFLHALISFGKLLLITGGCALLGLATLLLTRRIRKSSKAFALREDAPALMVLTIAYASLAQICLWVFLNRGYEVFALHLTAILLLGLIWLILYIRESGQPAKKQAETSMPFSHKVEALLPGIYASLLSLVAILASTDLSMEVSIPQISFACFALAALLCDQWDHKSPSPGKDASLSSLPFSDLTSFLLLIWCLTALVGKGYSVRGGIEYNSVMDTRGIMKYGPAKYCVSSYMGAYIYNCDYEDWQEYLQDGDRVLIVVDQVMSPGTIQYLFRDVSISHFSIIDPTTYDAHLLEYWQRYPDKTPNVIIVDCWYGQLMTDPDGFVMQYVRENFDKNAAMDGRYIRIYRR